MKQIRFTILLLALSAAAVTLFSCAQAPQDEEKAAKDAIEVARNAEASIYASKEWSDADQMYTTAETKMSAKEYDEAKNLFIGASEKARVAKESADRNKADLNEELASSKEAVEKAVKQVKMDFRTQRAKVSKRSANAIAAAIKDAENNLAEANRLIVGGKLMDAKLKFTDASNKAAEATSALGTTKTAKHKQVAAKKNVQRTVKKIK